jgi:aspartate/methionine/tyrosine aminotransferase
MKEKLKIIVAAKKEPFILESRIEPYDIGFTTNLIANKTGGLSYDDEQTSTQLIEKIKQLYKDIYGITLPEDAQIILGVGMVQLMSGYFYAVQKIRNQLTSVSFYNSERPRFAFFKGIVEITKNCEFVERNGDVNVIVSPMNPNGALFEYEAKLKKGFVLFDLFYDNPIYTGQFAPVSKDVYKVFNANQNCVLCNSFSAFGMPGTRCGFFIVRNPKIVEEMKYFVKYNTISNSSNISVANQAISKFFLQKDFYVGPFNRLMKRLETFNKLAKKLDIAILNKSTNVPFAYTGKSLEFWLETFSVRTAPGSEFDDTNEHSRLSLMIPEKDWQELISRMEKASRALK